MKIKITKHDLSLAQKELEKGKSKVNNCLIAKVLQRKYPNQEIQVRFTTATVGERVIKLPVLFDAEKYSRIAQILPIFLEINELA